MSRIVGIDLGTTNSLVAYVDGAASRGSSRTRRGAPCCRRSWPTRRPASWSARRRGGSSRATPRAPSTRSSASWAAATRTCGTSSRHFPFEVVPSAEVVRIRDRRPRGDAARGVGPRAARAQAAGGGPLRRAGRAGRDHRARLLQRRPAPGDQGRRAHRRARGAAHRQRADGRLARLRAPEAGPGGHRRLRPGRRDLRHLDPARQGRRLRGARHQRQHASGRRRLRPGDGRVAARRHPGRARRRSRRRTPRRCRSCASAPRPPSAGCRSTSGRRSPSRSRASPTGATSRAPSSRR